MPRLFSVTYYFIAVEDVVYCEQKVLLIKICQILYSLRTCERFCSQWTQQGLLFAVNPILLFTVNMSKILFTVNTSNIVFNASTKMFCTQWTFKDFCLLRTCQICCSRNIPQMLFTVNSLKMLFTSKLVFTADTYDILFIVNPKN